MSLATSFKYHYAAYGLRGPFLAALARLFESRRETMVIYEGFKHPMYLRVRSSDTALFTEIIKQKSYNWNPPKPPKMIVDAGANVGLASIWFANRFPESRIVAIEPDPDNYRMLRKNTVAYPQIALLNAALWGSAASLDMDYSAQSTAGWQVRESGNGKVQGVTMSEVMSMYGLDHIDLLKVDIEGSEKEVFESSTVWINRVGSILIELHDRFKPGCGKAVFSATRDFRQECDFGELSVFVR